jgi:sigma-B regulation protein RsbU (phosphoserine phosphatase)
LLVRKDPITSELQITPPAEVARELNRRFPMETQGELYFTKAYGILDLETNLLRYVSAGHPPMILVPRNGQPQFLPGDGFAIGMIEDIDYDEHTVQLQPGDRIVYYSDGVPEAMNQRLEQFSNNRLLSVLAAGAESPLSECVEGLFEAVRNWCLPLGPKDDVSILACEIVGRAGQEPAK